MMGAEKNEFASTVYLTTKKEGELEVENAGFLVKLWRLKNYITVEPFLLCYFLPSIISTVAVQKLNLEKACRVNLNYSEQLCLDVINGAADGNATSATSVIVAHMSAWQTPLGTAIPAIFILPIGAWSDRSGNRKVLMLVALIGQLVSAIGMLLTTYFFLEWPLFVTALIEALPPAIAGGFSIPIMAAFCYVADVTTKEERTLRIGIVTIIVTLSIPIATSVSGLLTQSFGYYGVFSLCTAIYIIGFLYTLFKIHDVKRENLVAKETSCYSILNLKYVVNVARVLYRKRPGSLRLRIWLLILVHVVIIGPVLGEAPVLFLYVLNQFNFTVVDYSIFSTFNTLIGLIGTSIAITLFSRLLKMDDTQLGIIATLCKVASSLVYTFAPTWQWFYAAPVVDIFGNSGSTAIRSLGTKIVEPDEVGKMASIIALAEAIAPVIYAPLYTSTYVKYISDFPSAFFLLGGAMTLPAVFIFIFMYTEWKKDNILKTEEKNGIPETVIEISHL